MVHSQVQQVGAEVKVCVCVCVRIRRTSHV